MILLLPQLLLLGMGRSLVICVAADGHMQIEVAASDCCESSDTVQAFDGPLSQSGEPGESDDCDSCSDVAVQTGQVAIKKLLEFQLDLDPLLPFSAWHSAFQFETPTAFPQPSRAQEPVLMYPAQLSCVVLRC